MGEVQRSQPGADSGAASPRIGGILGRLGGVREVV